MTLDPRRTSWESVQLNYHNSLLQLKDGNWHFGFHYYFCCLGVWKRCIYVSKRPSKAGITGRLLNLPGIYMDTGNPNPGPPAYIASSLIAEIAPSLNFLIAFIYLFICVSFPQVWMSVGSLHKSILFFDLRILGIQCRSSDLVTCFLTGEAISPTLFFYYRFLFFYYCSN